MEMYNGNGTNNKIQIRMSHAEILEYVIRKYKNLDTHPVSVNRKKLEVAYELEQSIK
jgi:hypothetical protein